MSEVVDCISRALIGTTYSDAVQAEVEGAKAAVEETTAGGGQSRQPAAKLPLSKTAAKGQATLSYDTIEAVHNDTAYRVLLFKDGSGPVCEIMPDHVVATSAKSQCRSSVRTQAIVTLVPNASYELYAIEGTSMSSQMVHVMKWTGDRGLVDQRRHLVITAAQVVMLPAATALRRLQHRFRARYTKMRSNAADIIIVWYRAHYYSWLLRRVDAANKIIRSIGLKAKVQLEEKRRIMVKPCAVARGFLARLTKPCQICLEDVQRCKFVTMHKQAQGQDGEAHEFCKACVGSFIDSSIDDGRLHIQCPAYKCSVDLTSAMLTAISSSKTVARLETNRKLKFTSHLETLNKKAADGTADKNTLEFLAWARSNVRVCPSCRVIIYRFAGCDHMRCRCGVSFNWQTVRAKDALVLWPPAFSAPLNPRC
mmetsp:Transcript_30809/g.52847  ORF Transcript_30809/g.52847 Transcript_30809/m.52847 type:complete len:423 (-) Transcript_30809:363-1631(-)